MKRSERLALLAVFFLAISQSLAAQGDTASSPQPGKELRAGSLDVVLLLDKSLSMASCIEAVKAYAASKVISPVLVPGDRLIVEAVYGKVDRLVTATIGSDEDIAKAIRAIRGLKADGRFTDLGAALDAAKRDLDELGQPGRPKYVLLLTDERQEAPKGSPYQARDFKLKHPLLQYTKRMDLGKFRAITVGLQVAEKVDATAPALMQLLESPPLRDDAAFAAGSQVAGGAKAGSAGVKTATGAKTGTAPGGVTAAERALPAWLLYGAAILLLAALAGLGIVLLISKRKEKQKGAEPASDS